MNENFKKLEKDVKNTKEDLEAAKQKIEENSNKGLKRDERIYIYKHEALEHVSQRRNGHRIIHLHFDPKISKSFFSGFLL